MIPPTKQEEEYIRFLKNNEEKNKKIWEKTLAVELKKIQEEELNICGHPWSFRYKNTDRCMVCCGTKSLVGVNDLFTLNPHFIKYYDYEKNAKAGIFPEKVVGSLKTIHLYTFPYHKICKNSSLRGFEGFQNKDLSLPHTLINKKYSPPSREKIRQMYCQSSDADLNLDENLTNQELEYKKFLDENERKNISIWKKIIADFEKEDAANERMVCGHSVLFLDKNKRYCRGCNGNKSTPGKDDVFSSRPDIIKYFDYDKNMEEGVNFFNFGPNPTGKKAYIFPCSKMEKKSSYRKLEPLLDKNREISIQSIRGVKKVCDAKKIPQAEDCFDEDKNLELFEGLKYWRKSYWWKCQDCNNSYDASMMHFAKNPNPCPYCSNRKLLPNFNSLGAKYPESVKFWDYEKNKKTPHEHFSTVHKQVYWLCASGHSYKKTINHQTSYGFNSCPLCVKEDVIDETNNIGSQIPNIDKCWSHKNKNCHKKIKYVSNEQYWFVCKNGHHSKKRLHTQKIYPNGCRRCSKYISAAEQELEKKLKDYFPSLELKTQIKIGCFVADFVVEDEKFVIEYNGTYWHMDPRVYVGSDFNPSMKKTAQEVWEKDAKKLEVYGEHGYTTIVVWEEDYQKNKDQCFNDLKDRIERIIERGK